MLPFFFCLRGFTSEAYVPRELGPYCSWRLLPSVLCKCAIEMFLCVVLRIVDNIDSVALFPIFSVCVGRADGLLKLRVPMASRCGWCSARVVV